MQHRPVRDLRGAHPSTRTADARPCSQALPGGGEDHTLGPETCRLQVPPARATLGRASPVPVGQAQAQDAAPPSRGDASEPQRCCGPDVVPRTVARRHGLIDGPCRLPHLARRTHAPAPVRVRCGLRSRATGLVAHTHGPVRLVRPLAAIRRPFCAAGARTLPQANTGRPSLVSRQCACLVAAHDPTATPAPTPEMMAAKNSAAPRIPGDQPGLRRGRPGASARGRGSPPAGTSRGGRAEQGGTPVPGPGPRPESALVLAVPEAEAAVGALRAAHDPSAADGMPAHITLLYPFRDPARVDAALLAELAAFFAQVPAWADCVVRRGRGRRRRWVSGSRSSTSSWRKTNRCGGSAEAAADGAEDVRAVTGAAPRRRVGGNGAAVRRRAEGGTGEGSLRAAGVPRRGHDEQPTGVRLYFRRVRRGRCGRALVGGRHSAPTDSASMRCRNACRKACRPAASRLALSV